MTAGPTSALFIGFVQAALAQAKVPGTPEAQRAEA